MKHSIRGTQYYIIYVDDCTRYTEVYLLVTKTMKEISAKFQHYQAWVETQGFHTKQLLELLLATPAWCGDAGDTAATAATATL